MIKTVENARFVSNGGRVVLEVMLNGNQVTIFPDQLKYTLVDQGLVALCGDFVNDPDYDMVAVVDVESGEPKYVVVSGCTNNTRVVNLARRLLRMANDEEAIPEVPVEI